MERDRSWLGSIKRSDEGKFFRLKCLCGNPDRPGIVTGTPQFYLKVLPNGAIRHSEVSGDHYMEENDWPLEGHRNHPHLYGNPDFSGGPIHLDQTHFICSIEEVREDEVPREILEPLNR